MEFFKFLELEKNPWTMKSFRSMLSAVLYESVFD